MIEAILHGKVSSHIRKQEDVLTSNVFGLLACLEWSFGLGPWLADSRRLDNALLGKASPGRLVFWPSLVHPAGGRCEPDVVILPPERRGPVLFVECKLASGPSGLPTKAEGDEVRGQLGQQWQALCHGWAREDVEEGESETPGRIVYLTRDWVMPRSTLVAMVKEIETKSGDFGLAKALYWLSWRHLNMVLERHPAPSAEGRRIQDQLKRLMDHLDLCAFSGFSRPVPPRVSWNYTYGFRLNERAPLTWTYGATP